MTMTTKPMWIVEVMLAGWLGRLPGAAWRRSEQLSEGRLVARMRKLTLLGNAERALWRAVKRHLGWQG